MPNTLVMPGARALLLFLVAALSACGSTLQQAGLPQQGAGADGLPAATALDGSVAPVEGTTASGELAAPGGTGGSEATATGGGPTGTGASSGAPSPGSGTGTAGSTGAGAKTVVAGKVRVGIVTVDVTALFAVFGQEDKAPDPYAADKAFISAINQSGGIGGLPVEAEFVTLDIQDDYNAEGQRACETFTEDKKVDIVKSNNFSNEVLLSCLQQRGVAVVDINRWSSDRASVEHPNWLVPDAMRVDRYTPALIDMSVEQGVLKQGNKLGVLYEDCPWGSRVYNNVIKPAASKHGVTTEPATVKCVENLVADLGPATNQIRAAVLRFRSAGVTHVLVASGAEGFAVVMFQRAASEQAYLPKYLITTNAFPYSNGHPDRPAAIRFSADALPNMSGIGFEPMLDLGDGSTPANAGQSSVQAECRKADPTAGTGTVSDYSQWELRVLFYSHCDAWFTLRNLLRANGLRFGVADVVAGYRTALPAAASALNAGGRFGFGGSGLDGVGFVQPLRYDAATKKFVYTGPARAVS